MEAIKLIEKLGKLQIKFCHSKRRYKTTLANIESKKDLKIKSGYSLKKGLSNFIDWYDEYHNL